MFSRTLKLAVLAGCLGGLVCVEPVLAEQSASSGAQAATPIEIPGGEPKMKQQPSRKATPIEIPDKGKPQPKKKPSAEATPIEIPGKGKPQITQKPSVRGLPVPIPGPQQR